jgi:hypothetical protein
MPRRPHRAAFEPLRQALALWEAKEKRPCAAVHEGRRIGRESRHDGRRVIRLQARVTALQSRVAALDDRVSALQDQITAQTGSASSDDHAPDIRPYGDPGPLGVVRRGSRRVGLLRAVGGLRDLGYSA